MRVLHVVYSLVPGVYRGGIPKVVHELGAAQARAGHSVTVYTTDYNGSVRADVHAGEGRDSDGVRIEYFGAVRFPEFGSPGLKRAIDGTARDFDVLHAHNTFLPFNRYVAAARRRTGMRAFFQPHGALDPRVLYRGLTKAIKKAAYIALVERRNLNASSGILAVTGDESDQLRRLRVRAPIFVLPNGTSMARRRAAADGGRFRRRFGIASDQSIVLFVGRLDPKKALDLLIRAHAEVRRERGDALLVLGGDRDQFRSHVRQLDDLARDLGVTDGIVWTGFLDEEQKADALAAATAFSHVSRSEGMAMAILESMAMGVPTLVGKGCRMSAAAGAGALVECAEDPRALASALRGLIDSQAEREVLGRRAAEWAAAHHSWDEIARRSIEIYAGQVSAC